MVFLSLGTFLLNSLSPERMQKEDQEREPAWKSTVYLGDEHDETGLGAELAACSPCGTRASSAKDKYLPIG